MTPTQAQKEAALDAFWDHPGSDGSDLATAVVAALTAAAQVEEPPTKDMMIEHLDGQIKTLLRENEALKNDLAIRYGMQTGGDLWKATIERCAQVAESICPNAYPEVAAAIRALKDKP